MREREDGRKEISTEEESTFRYSAKIDPGGDGPEPVYLDAGMYFFRGGAGHYQGQVMWGLLENAKEIGMVDNMSLESSYALWRQGGLRNTMAIYFHAAERFFDSGCAIIFGSSSFSNGGSIFDEVSLFNTITGADFSSEIWC